MSKHWKDFKKPCFEMSLRDRVLSGHDSYGTFNSYSKFDNFKKLSVLAQILSFL